MKNKTTDLIKIIPINDLKPQQMEHLQHKQTQNVTIWGIIDLTDKLIGHLTMKPTKNPMFPGSQIEIVIDPQFDYCFYDIKVCQLIQANPTFWDRIIWLFSPTRNLSHPWTMGPDIATSQDKFIYSYFHCVFHHCNECYFKMCYLDRLKLLKETKDLNYKLAQINTDYNITQEETIQRKLRYDMFHNNKTDIQCRFIVRNMESGIGGDVRAYQQFFINNYVVDLQKAGGVDLHNIQSATKTYKCQEVDDNKFVDINFYMEVPLNACMNKAHINILMPNYEYLIRKDTRAKNISALQKINYMICKARITFDYCEKLKSNPDNNLKYKCIYTKHTSIVPPIYRMVNIKRDTKTWLHAAGRSEWKQTDSVLAAWGKHPEWPRLVVTCRERCDSNEYLQEIYKANPQIKTAGNIETHKFLDDLNKSQYQILNHICPSIVEGYGHYINEARAYGCFIVTSNYPPMNELVDNESGFLIQCSKIQAKPKSPDVNLCIITPEDIEKSMEYVFEQISIEERTKRGQNAFKNYLNDTQFFAQEMNKFIPTIKTEINKK